VPECFSLYMEPSPGPGSSASRAAYRAALGRLSLMDDEILAIAREMKAIYPVMTIDKHLKIKAEASGVPVVWTSMDLELYFSENSPEAFLPARRALLRPPPDIASSLSTLLLGRELCCGWRLPPSAVFETRNGHLRLAMDRPSTGSGINSWVEELGECADVNCGCFRGSHPQVRRRFRDFVCHSASVAHSRHRGGGGYYSSNARRGLRYASIGSGGLLFDLELLLALQAKQGCGSIESAIVVDRKYSFDGKAVLRFESILGPSCEVHAFGHVDSFVMMAETNPHVFGNVDILVQSDADDIDDEATARVVAAGLATEGVALILRGDGTIIRRSRGGGASRVHVASSMPGSARPGAASVSHRSPAYQSSAAEGESPRDDEALLQVSLSAEGCSNV
jgi:hypothetical protein